MLSSPSSERLREAAHYCPFCLRRVRAAQAERRSYHEACCSGDLEIALLLCPTCGLALAAEAVESQTPNL